MRAMLARAAVGVVVALLGCGVACAEVVGGAGLDRVLVEVDASRPGVGVNPAMYGIFLEEINTAIDGGLYAEMVRNRGFEEAAAPEGFELKDGKWVNAGGYATDFLFEAEKSLPYWTLRMEKGGKGEMRLEREGGINEATPRACRVEVRELPAGGRVAIANEGYWGMAVKAGERYRVSFWAKGETERDEVEVGVWEEGKALTSSARVSLGGSWKKYTVDLTGETTSARGSLALSVKQAGVVWFDMVSMFPRWTYLGRENGMRADVAGMIAELKPGFVRFPGGCVVEGATVETAYRWKGTIGPVEQRREVWNVWDYRRTHGVGLHEYLQFCEDIGAEPMYVGFAGQNCIYRRNTKPVPMEKMGEWADELIDVLEYANGGVETTWGRKRAEMGREKPFGMRMVEIGNENVGREYEQRYGFIYERLKARWPEVLAISCIPQREAPTEMVDEHYYSSSNWFIQNQGMYDRRDRGGPKVYLGEVAVTTVEAGVDRGNLRAALAEGVFLIGAERNADVVRMVSYAPLLANVKGRTALAGSPPPWHGMVYFDNSRVFGTASYYLWKMFGRNVPERTVGVKVEKGGEASEKIRGAVGVGTWGTSAEFKDIRVESGGRVLLGTELKDDKGWKKEGGRWEVTPEGTYRQGREAVGFATTGGTDWGDYTVSLKARKLSGGEGFLILFGMRGEDRMWWNLGGWGNTRHGVEHNQSPVGDTVEGKIETGRWYDIRVEVSGMRVRCYLDGVLVHDAVARERPPLYVGAGVRGEEAVVKLINVKSEPVRAEVRVLGGGDAADAEMLTSGSPSDNNTLERPERVVPVAREVRGTGGVFDVELPANSLTVMRVRLGK